MQDRQMVDGGMGVGGTHKNGQAGTEIGSMKTLCERQVIKLSQGRCVPVNGGKKP